MKRGKKIAGVILVVLFAYIYAHVAKTNMIYDKEIDSSEYVGIGIPAEAVEQEFLCREDTLDGIKVKCQLHGDTNGVTLNMVLKDVESGQIVAQAEQHAEDIKNGKFNSFTFDTVENCRDQKYKVIFTNAGNEGRVGEGVGLMAQPERENATNLVVDEEEQPGTLIMKTVTNRFDFETFVVLLCIVFYATVFFNYLGKLFSR